MATQEEAVHDELDGAARRERLGELDSSIGEQGGNLAAAQCRLLLEIGEFDRLEGWHAHGARSLEEWLSWRIGTSGKLARDYAVVARKLGDLPALKKAFGAGELSLSKARAICSVATEGTEAMLVEWARSASAADMDRIARTWSKMKADELLVDAERKRASRSCNYFVADDGMLHLRARLVAEEGALVVSALEQIEARDKDAPDASRAPEQRSADALVQMAERSLASTGTVADRYLATIHIDLDVLTEENPEGRCEIYPGAGLHPATASRLLCDCPVVSVVYKNGGPIDVGRKTRAISARMRRALEARDHGCRYPGCTRKVGLDAHHIWHWVLEGPTELDNLCLLCRHHHRLVHEGGVTMAKEGDAFVFRDRYGKVVPNAPPQAATTDVMKDNKKRGLTIDDRTIVPPHYAGDPVDMDVVMFVLEQETPEAQ